MDPRRKKIIVADDSHTFVMYMAILLKRMGFSVIPAENGDEVFRLTKIMSADLVMLDMTLAGDDGLTVLKKIRKKFRTRKLPVVMILPPERAGEISEACREAGASGYLVKPVRIVELHNVLEGFLFRPAGINRRFMRTEFRQKVQIQHNGSSMELFSETLSEGGVYLRMQEPLSTGERLSLSLPLDGTGAIDLHGTVLYSKGLFGDKMRLPPGIAVGFEDISPGQSIAIRRYIQLLMAQDLIEAQEEPVLELGMGGADTSC